MESESVTAAPAPVGAGGDLSFEELTFNTEDAVLDEENTPSIGDAEEDSPDCCPGTTSLPAAIIEEDPKFRVDSNTLVVEPVNESQVSTILPSLQESFPGLRSFFELEKPNCLHIRLETDSEVEEAIAKLESLKVDDVNFTVHRCHVEEASATPAAPLPPNPIIVIKNLAFNLKHEKMMDILSRMDISPVQLHYHYDAQGTFRGMAFAKYKSVEESAKAFEALQGQEILGRKLRIEFKKKGTKADKEERADSRSSSRRNSVAEPVEIDLNDEDTRKVFDQLLRFKDNNKQDSLSFPATFTSEDRSRVLAIADKLELQHSVQQTPDGRAVTVSKKKRRMSEAHVKGIPIQKGSNASNRNRRSTEVAEQQRDSGNGNPRRNTEVDSRDQGHTRSRRNSDYDGCPRPPLNKGWGSSSPPTSGPVPKDKDKERDKDRDSQGNGSAPHASFMPLSSSPMATLGADLMRLSPAAPHLALRRKSGGDAISLSMMQGVRVPKGPDGSKGFSAGRGKALPASLPQVSAS